MGDTGGIAGGSGCRSITGKNMIMDFPRDIPQESPSPIPALPLSETLIHLHVRDDAQRIIHSRDFFQFMIVLNRLIDGLDRGAKNTLHFVFCPSV
jgi:hypothetical protein